MNQNDAVRKNNSEYEPLHSTVIVNDRLKPVRIIIPVIVIIMIIAVMSVYSYFQRQNIIENIEQVTNQMAEYIAGNIANEMDYAKSSIKFASSAISQSMTSDTLENPAEIITPMVENSPFDQIEYIRADGTNVMNIGRPFDASDRVYYTEGIKGNTGVWNNYHPMMSQETLMNFYTPIFYRGEITGVLTGYIAATTQLAPLFETSLFGEYIYGLLVDENDMVICSTIESEYVKDLTLDTFMDGFDIAEDQKLRIRNTINNATELAVSYKDPSGDGRICATKIPGTEWKVVIVVPDTSFQAIVNRNTRDAVITILIIGLLLISYAASVLFRNVKRRREIAKENAKLEEENRDFDEENKRVFREISAIRDINASANMGTWRIELLEGKEPRMYADDTMKALLGISGKVKTPEETYGDWFNNITPQAISSVFESVEKMKQGRFDENTYLWIHPNKGERYVRSGGTAQKIHDGYLLRGYHYDVDEVVRDDLAKVAMLQEALNEKNDYYNTLGTLAGVYNSLQVIDLLEDTVVEFSARESFKDIVDHKRGAGEMLAYVMTALTTDECRDRALEYTDLRTLADRMQKKKYIATQLVSKRIGWFLASFISLETDADGRPTRVIFTTQSIDEEKRQEEILIHRSRTDELTGLLNRRAYEEDIYEKNDVPVKDCFVSMSLDVNGLKAVNDTLGHAAGDELLVGASQCMKKSLGPYGKIYRTGGDEFIAILFCDNGKLKEVLADFEETMAKWKGKLVGGLTVSYGFVSKEEEPELSVRELGAIADKRMYEAKSAYYRKKGVDRRGHQDAHRALCGLYTKILKINISDDTYQIVNMDVKERTEEKGFSDKISSWLSSFGRSGQVHPDDLQEYLDKTDVQFMRDYFAGNNTSLSIIYRRKYGEEYKLAIMEIIPANDYSETNQSLYLYVKSINKTSVI
ncbi:MAG: sensor domain-containing diguanylate cyclase [Oscillospiraceae bacterium]|nr:sensor domain-containing diguanylate cyclase [Oscillospiraceae bacterium]